MQSFLKLHISGRSDTQPVAPARQNADVSLERHCASSMRFLGLGDEHRGSNTPTPSLQATVDDRQVNKMAAFLRLG